MLMEEEEESGNVLKIYRRFCDSVRCCICIQQKHAYVLMDGGVRCPSLNSRSVINNEIQRYTSRI